MKITLGSKALLEKLQFLSGALPSKSPVPILDNFHFENLGNILTMTATDMETTMESTIDAKCEGTINIAVPAKMLIDVLKSFPDQPLEFKINKGNTIDITSASGEYQIYYEDGKLFPALPEHIPSEGVEVPAKVLAMAITKTIMGTGNDDLRPTLAGVLFQLSPEGSNFVATDAHKLIKYSRVDVKTTEAAEFIVPKKPLNILKGLLGSSEANVHLQYTASNAIFTFSDYVVTCRLVEGKYPNYEAVIPQENPNVMVIGRVPFLNSVKCVSIFSNRLTHQIRFKFAGAELNLSAEDIDYSNRAEERLTCDYQGEDLTIGFNARFLAELLQNICCDNISLEMSTPQRGGILRPVEGLAEGEDLMMLVMPVLLNK